LGLVREGAAAEAAVAEGAKRTSSRRELSKHDRFDEVSPDVGYLDEAALEDVLGDSPDDALALLADLTGATDPKLRALAQRLASRVVVDLARRGSPRRRGVGKLALRPLDESGADLDLDSSIDALAVADATSSAPDPDEVRVRGWSRPGTALCLVVDRSGSMGGERLATAAVAAAAVAWRAPEDYSVLAFGRDVVVAKAQDAFRAPEQVVTDLLTLRGFGTTDLALALRTAGEQLARSRAARRLTVLLSDCRATVPGDAAGAARTLEELVIVAPADDRGDAEELAAAVGAQCVPISGPSAIPDVFNRLLPS
jgi:Mg-chelatase subunit ChlD